MTPKEARAEMLKIEREIGARADVFVNLSSGGEAADLAASIYPDGVGKNLAFRVHADDFPELFIRIRTKWAEHNQVHRQRRIREMALKIIEVTANKGECTDSSLRAADFLDEEIQQYGEDAVKDADVLASNGPFSIKKKRGANAA